MRDGNVIIAALIVFVVVVTSPIWYARAAGTTARGPEPTLPETGEACVMPVEYMRASHMDLLLTWRDDVVRRQDRAFVSPDGRTYTKSLTGTCLRCHARKAEFCDRCHTYAGVTPHCWDCHVAPAPQKGSGL
jgi:cytochrome c553